MLTIDLPPEALGNPDEVVAAAASRPGRPPLAPKRAWRRDALIKQLADPTVLAESAGLLEAQSRDIYHAFKPRNGWQDWLVSTISTIMLRLNRCERIERKLRDLASYRAIEFWEEDQRAEVEALALKLGREPARTVARLRMTPAGVDWLLARWRGLSRLDPAAWTDAQRDLAGLLAGDESVDPAAIPGSVPGRIEELVAFRARVVEADALVRGRVEADLDDDRVLNLARLRRDVRALQRQLKWYVDQFHVEHPDRWDDPRRRPAVLGPVVEAYRPRNPDHFEGRPAPPEAAGDPVDPLDETKPLAPESTPDPEAFDLAGIRCTLAGDEAAELVAALARPDDETKPSDADAARPGDETDPLAPPTPAPASFAIEPPAAFHDYSNEKGKHHSRPLKAGERSREYARRLKRARRRTDLALAELT